MTRFFRTWFLIATRLGGGYQHNPDRETPENC